MHFVLLFMSFLLCIVTNRAESRVTGSRCPVSKAFDTADDFLYRYPQRMYANSSLIGIPLTSYNCTHYDDHHLRLKCLANGDICPITANNVYSTLRSTTWPQYGEAFRRIQQSLHNKEDVLKVNVFILGGSMTHGSETRCACVCASHVDNRCPNTPPDEKCDETRCSWASFLKTWLSCEYSHIKWNFLDFAGSGVDSKRMADYIGDYIRRAKVEFTDNDIIFIDHSVNDVGKVDTHVIQLPLAFELLIRRILVISYRNRVRPTIVVLEQYPHSSLHDAKKRVIADPTRLQDYAYVYRRISKHYGLILWSIRDVYWSYFDAYRYNSSSSTTSAPASHTVAPHPEGLYQVNPFDHIHIHVHPPWYIHLFIADLLGNCWLHALRTIEQQAATVGISNNSSGGSSDGSTNASSGGGSSIDDVTMKVKHTEWLLRPFNGSTEYELPPPLYEVLSLPDKYSVCNLYSPYMIDAQPNTTFKPQNVTVYESETAAKSEGWRQYIDFHDTPGWIINNFSHPEKRNLTFPIANCSGKFCYVGKVLRVLYLRSYTGMGRVNVHICGELAYKAKELGKSTIDGLDVFEKFSVPNSYIHKITPPEAQRCESLPMEQRAVQIIYDPAANKRDEHDALRDANHRKFKLLHVQMCSAASFV